MRCLLNSRLWLMFDDSLELRDLSWVCCWKFMNFEWILNTLCLIMSIDSLLKRKRLCSLWLRGCYLLDYSARILKSYILHSRTLFRFRLINSWRWLALSMLILMLTRFICFWKRLCSLFSNMLNLSILTWQLYFLLWRIWGELYKSNLWI